MNIKFIYWFAYYNLDSPSVRYRGKYPLEELKNKYGVEYFFVCPGYSVSSIIHFIRTYFSALFFRKENSLIVFQRLYSKGIYASALKLLLFFQKKVTLYDLDDAEYVERPPETIHYFMTNCEACSLGSKSLVEYTKKYNPNSFLLTSPVTNHNETKRERNQVFTVGWIGMLWGGNWNSLNQLLFPALKEIKFPLRLVILGAERDEFRQKMVSNFSDQNNISIETPLNINWYDEASIYERIKEFDLGVSPLLDTEINRGKSAYKLKQYLSCGVPAIGSDVGENSRFLKNGINGFLCNTPEDFRKMIEKINGLSKEEYDIFCLNAKETVNQFNLENYCSTLIKVPSSTSS